MSKILIANIGNRTIIEKNHENKAIGQKDFVAPDGSIHSGTFKQLTKKILDNNWFEMVKTNIINKLIEGHINELEQIYLFVSNQPGEYTQQDTKFAGQILKKLIASEYHFSEDNIHVVEIKANIVGADQLIPIYRSELLKMKNENKDKIFIFCDSGGTPQQKTSLKIVAEYLFKGIGYEYKQVIQKADYNETLNFEDAIVKDIEAVEYQKVIADENIILLVQKGNYKGAKTLRLSVSTDKDLIYNILSFLDLRISRLNLDSNPIINQLVFKSQFPSIEKYHRGEPIGDFYNWVSDFYKRDFFQLCEILSIAQFYWGLKEFSDAVLMYQIFIENYCRFFIKKKLGFDLVTNNRAVTDAINQNHYYDIKPHVPLFWTEKSRFNRHTNRQEITELDLKISLPVNIVFVNKSGLGSVQSDQISDSFFQCIRFDNSNTYDGLDTLRNDIAHNGIGIKSTSEINSSIIGDFEQIISEWHKAFGLPSENVYITGNKEIEGFLRNN